MQPEGLPEEGPAGQPVQQTVQVGWSSLADQGHGQLDLALLPLLRPVPGPARLVLVPVRDPVEREHRLPGPLPGHRPVRLLDDCVSKSYLRHLVYYSFRWVCSVLRSFPVIGRWSR